MYNLTFNDNSVYKIYMSEENKDEGKLIITMLSADYVFDDVKSYFEKGDVKEKLKRIIKTTDNGSHVSTFENYTEVLSKSIATINISSEVNEDIPIINESGEKTSTTIVTTVFKPVESIKIVLKYEDPTKIIVDKLNQQINPSIDVGTCSLNELRNWQKIQVNSDCTATIERGVDVKLSDQKTYHYSYKVVDQINYTEMYQEIEYDGFTMLPYHPDNGDCVIYSAADIKTIILAQRTNKFVLTTKCNAYHRMIDEATTKDDILKITWGSALSKEKQDALNTILSSVMPKK